MVTVHFFKIYIAIYKDSYIFNIYEATKDLTHYSSIF